MGYDGCRKVCRDCRFFWEGEHVDDYYRTCTKLSNLLPGYDIAVCETNNICNQFEDKISKEPFDFHEYLVWLKDEYYKPEKVVDGKLVDVEDYRVIHFPDCFIKLVCAIPDDKKCSLEGCCFSIKYNWFVDQSFIDGGFIIHNGYTYKKGNGQRGKVDLPGGVSVHEK